MIMNGLALQAFKTFLGNPEVMGVLIGWAFTVTGLLVIKQIIADMKEG